MLEQLDRIPPAARTSLLKYLNDPARSVAELDRVFGPILGERLSRAIIGAAPFDSLVDLVDKVSGIGEQKLIAMVSAQLEGRVPSEAGARSTPTRGSRVEAAPAAGHPPPPAPATFAGAGTVGAACFGYACFAPVGAQCFATTTAVPWPPQTPHARNSAPARAEDEHHDSTTKRESMAETTTRTPTFEEAYRARLAQIQSYWKAIDVEAIDLSMVQPSAMGAGCFGTAGTIGTIGTGGGCFGTVGTALCFGSSNLPMDNRLAAGPTPYATNPYAMNPYASPYAQQSPGVLAGTAGTFGTAGTAGCIGGTIGSMATIGTRGCWG